MFTYIQFCLLVVHTCLFTVNILCLLLCLLMVDIVLVLIYFLVYRFNAAKFSSLVGGRNAGEVIQASDQWDLPGGGHHTAANGAREIPWM